MFLDYLPQAVYTREKELGWDEAFAGKRGFLDAFRYYRSSRDSALG